MEIRYNLDPDTGFPHIYAHGVTEDEVEDVLRSPLERLSGTAGSKVLLGKTRAGRYLRVVASFDEDGMGVFVITAYDLVGKPRKALKRRRRRRGRP
jgi:hypothetical protein